MRGSTAVGRIAALIALAVVVVAVVMLFTGGDEEYTVTAEFENASQLVNGNEVVVGGAAAGTVKEIELGDDGAALVTFTVDDQFAPLKRGTTATVRSFSLSGIANRQVQLTLPPESEDSDPIEDGGLLTRQETVSEVDLDQIFNTLDTETVKDFKRVIKGFQLSYEGVATKANRGFRYLNPFLSTSRRVFGELTRDTAAFENLLVDGAQLSGLLAERASDISALIGNLNAMMGAIGRQRGALSEAIARLPGFMREANTTFVNLRAALDDVDPLIAASIPVAERLRPFFREFRAAAAGAVPTIRDLDAIVRKPGAGNDLVELTRAQVPLARVGVGSGAPDCGPNPDSLESLEQAQDDDFSQGALGESACALRNGLPQLSHFRGYTPELVGWFNDFGTSGIIDSNGGIGRIHTTFNAFTFQLGLPEITPGFGPDVGEALKGVDQSFNNPFTSGPDFLPGYDIGNNKRCPGANERDPGDGSTPFTDGGTLNCDPSQVPTGP